MIWIQQTSIKVQTHRAPIQSTNGTFSCLDCDTRYLVIPWHNTVRIDPYPVAWESATVCGTYTFLFSPSEIFSGSLNCRSEPESQLWKIPKYLIKPYPKLGYIQCYMFLRITFDYLKLTASKYCQNVCLQFCILPTVQSLQSTMQL